MSFDESFTQQQWPTALMYIVSYVTLLFKMQSGQLIPRNKDMLNDPKKTEKRSFH